MLNGGNAVGGGVKKITLLFQHIERFKRAVDHIKMNLAVDAAVGQIVRKLSERRDVIALPGVALDRDDVVSSECDKICDLASEGGISAVMLSHVRAVDPDFRRVRHAVKREEKPFAVPFTGQREDLAVTRDRLIFFFIEIVKRRDLHAVGYPYLNRIAALINRIAELVVIYRSEFPTVIKFNSHLLFLSASFRCGSAAVSLRSR